MAERNFPSEAYVLLDTCRDLAEAGSDDMDDAGQQLCAAIDSGSWGFFAKRAAKSELVALIANCDANAEMAAGWAQQSGDEALRRQSECFARLADALRQVSI